MGKVFGLPSKLGFGLDDHLPGPPEQVEVIDVQRAFINPERVGKILQAHSPHHARARVGIDVQLGDVGPKYRKQGQQARRLAPLPHEVINLLLHRSRAGVAAVFDHNRETSRPAHAAHRRRAEDGHAGFLDFGAASLAQLVDDRVARTIAFAAFGIILQADKARPEIGARCAQHERLAADPGDMANAWNRQSDLFDLSHDAVSAIQ